MDATTPATARPAPRHGPRRARELQRDDRAVTEVVGFLLMFALSAVILALSLRAFDVTQDHADRLASGVEMRSVANRVATRIVQAGVFSQEVPNATFTVDLRLPEQIGDFAYYVKATPNTVYVNATNERVRTNATTFRTEAVQDLTVAGKVFSSERVLRLTLDTTTTGTREITITAVK